MEFDFRIQLQTDPHRMPIESASVHLARAALAAVDDRAPAAARASAFDSPEQLAFARSLSFQPWHCVPEHRPLGSQNRARKAIYYELSKLRQSMNGDPRVEPDGAERFPLYTVAELAAARRGSAAPAGRAGRSRRRRARSRSAAGRCSARGPARGHGEGAAARGAGPISGSGSS